MEIVIGFILVGGVVMYVHTHRKAKQISSQEDCEPFKVEE